MKKNVQWQFGNPQGADIYCLYHTDSAKTSVTITQRKQLANEFQCVGKHYKD